MYRVSALLPSWDRSRQAAASAAPAPPRSPRALDKVFGWAEKIVVPVNRNSMPAAHARYGRETYWPTTLDKECDKAARILKSFCFDGFLSQQEPEQATHAQAAAAEPPAKPAYVSKKIPPRIIQNAVGLAVFSCMRSGLWMSGSGGAGLITARKADGTWSPPSAIILHTAELAFVMGVDIYDCVLVINSVHTLELFTRPRLILGADVNMAVGPLVAVGSQEPEIRWREISDTVLTYVKAKGKHQAVQLDGSLVTERANENERFYRSGVTVLDILAGNIPKSVPEMRPLFEVIKAAEGRSDYDKALMDWLAQQPAPGDAEIESPTASVTSPTKQAFGVPDASDPDPFGVIGLEMAGIEIREAGTKLRPTSTQFEYNPSPTSPVHGRFSRQSMDTFVSRSNRGSCMSARTQATAVTDAYTQTDVASTADTSYSRPDSDDGKDSVERLPTVVEPEEVDYTQVDTSIIEQLKRRIGQVPAPEPAAVAQVEKTKGTATTERNEEKPEITHQTAESNSPAPTPSPQTRDEQDEDADDEDDDDDDDDDDEEPIICEVATATAQPTRSSIQIPQVTQVIQAKGAIVTIPKRVPPPLPARSPARASRGSRSDFGDVSSLRSPIRNSFLSYESRRDDGAQTKEQPAQEPAEEKGSLPERPASPRHTKNSSSVCTALPVDDASPQEMPSTTSQPLQAESTPDPAAATAPSPAPQTPPQPLDDEPASSADDDDADADAESEREEPRTPLTGETDLDTPAASKEQEHHREAGKAGGSEEEEVVVVEGGHDGGARVVSAMGSVAA